MIFFIYSIKKIIHALWTMIVYYILDEPDMQDTAGEAGTNS